MDQLPSDPVEFIDCTQTNEPIKRPSTSTQLRSLKRQASILDLPFFHSPPRTILPTPPPSPPPKATVAPFPLTDSDYALADGIDDELIRTLAKGRKEMRREERRAAKRRRKRVDGRAETLKRLYESPSKIEVHVLEDEDDDEGDEEADFDHNPNSPRRCPSTGVTTSEDTLSDSVTDAIASSDLSEEVKDLLVEVQQTSTPSGETNASNGDELYEPLPATSFSTAQAQLDKLNETLDGAGTITSDEPDIITSDAISDSANDDVATDSISHNQHPNDVPIEWISSLESSTSAGTPKHNSTSSTDTDHDSTITPASPAPGGHQDAPLSSLSKHVKTEMIESFTALSQATPTGMQDVRGMNSNAPPTPASQVIFRSTKGLPYRNTEHTTQLTTPLDMI
ncbi:uncharacterized protein I303_107863 [Kwoniella dejecticola CBS 10117]|uniref:Uncharacterized protein n=1 Tax=Kwoniella dejecticola CBS 10117 TaxID=1296121 RepID=A0A1A5ZVW5_9TREE|nr:uncharacterized protein I303_07866 [Kwoniella dejecticola CBS 10117]OBR81953.1 hypothetical protein I303_07866 [Kwoniella dejecticola CBS 10117]